MTTGLRKTEDGREEKKEEEKEIPKKIV